MIPPHDATFNPSFNDVIGNLCKTLRRKDACNFARFISSGYDVINPKGLGLQSPHEQADSLDGPIDIASDPVDYTFRYKHLEQR